MEPLSRGLKVSNLGGSTTVDWTSAEIFIRDITSNVNLTFENVVDKRIRIIINNSTGSDYTLSLTVAGYNTPNLSDIMVRLRANRTQIYEFVADTTNLNVYCLSPLKLDSIWTP